MNVEPEVLAAIITASMALTGVIITAVVTLAAAVLLHMNSRLRERSQDRRHSQQLELEKQRAQVERNSSALQLYNQRQVLIFEHRLKTYPVLYEALMALRKSKVLTMTSEEAMQLADKLATIHHVTVGYCMSTEAFENLVELRDTLLHFSAGRADAKEVDEKRVRLYQSLSRDLGRIGDYLGDYPPMFEVDSAILKGIIES